MGAVNIEIKARCSDHEPLRVTLMAHQARYIGEDHQVDTYFNVDEGRLKLREGTIERSLIRYHRPDQEGPKRSDVMLHPVEEGHSASLKAILKATLGVKVVVDKRRHIFFIDNVKFHLDDVKGLGQFVEIEAIDASGERTVQSLQDQCALYMEKLNIQEANLIADSYSDMLMESPSG